MDGLGDDHTKWSKPDRERQISYDITYMQNLKKKNDTNELSLLHWAFVSVLSSLPLACSGSPHTGLLLNPMVHLSKWEKGAHSSSNILKKLIYSWHNLNYYMNLPWQEKGGDRSCPPSLPGDPHLKKELWVRGGVAAGEFWLWGLISSIQFQFS